MTEDPLPTHDPPAPAISPEVKQLFGAQGAVRHLSTATDAASDTRLTVAERIGHYHIKRTIGCGGMGTVYEAIQEHPRRPVALKVMNPDSVSRSALRRFEHESQLLARLRHPGIAQVYEAGTYQGPKGPVPFFAMEYIPNAKSITKYAHEKNLSTRQRLDMFVGVCEAADHGHQKGIIHRDLKPGNILVDPQGQVKLIDFGVARATDADLTVTTLQTGVGQLIGTLKYMSPEQCEADPLAIDRRSDVYALGVVLYELLTGKMPYDLEATPIFDAPRVIREVPPTPLSRVNKTLRGDVETIVAKALEKDRDHRYPSAHDLGEDIRRYLRNEPIIARPASAVYRLRKLLRRRRVPVSVAVIVGSALAFAAYAGVESRRAAAAAAVARESAGELISEVFLKQLDSVRRNPDQAISDCTWAIDLAPKAAGLYALRGKLFQFNHDYDRAWDDCNRALEIDPAESLALRTRGYLLLVRGEFQSSMDAYNKGIRGTDGLPEDFHNRARLHRLGGSYAVALRDHDRAIALAPKVGVVYQGRALTRLFSGDAEGSLEDLSKAASLDRKLANQYNLSIWEIAMLTRDPHLLEVGERALDAARDTATDDFDRRIVDMCSGTVTPQQILESVSDPLLMAMVYYYAGAKALVDGDRAQAVKWFQAYPTQVHDHLEFDLAKWHLEQLGER